MQTKFVKYSFFLLLLTAHTVSAQQPSQRQRVAGNNYIISKDETGKNKETVNTVIDNTSYQLILVNDKLTELHVDGKLVPPDQYDRYEEIVKKIKEQLRIDRIRAKKDQERAMVDQKKAKADQEEAMKDQAGAKLQQEKAAKDQQQAKRDQENAMKDQAAAKLQQEKAAKDQQQAKLDQENAMKDNAAAKLQQEKATKDQQQAKLDQENAMKDDAAAKLQQEKAAKDQRQAKLDQEQAIKDQAMAKIDEERAKEDQRLMKQLISDLLKDGIINDEKGLQSIKMSSTELLVNDKKQPEQVYLKYKAKYPRFATGNFSYEVSADGNKTMHTHQ